MFINIIKKASLLFRLSCISVFLFLLSGTAIAANLTPYSIDANTGILTVASELKYSYPRLKGQTVSVPEGATAYYESIVVNGSTRDYLVIRPNPIPVKAPVVMMFHPNGLSVQHTANMTKIADFAALEQFWAVLPVSKGSKWDDNPVTDSEDDVFFVAQLINKLVQQGANANKIYAAGYSNGGFFSERLACQFPENIAAFGILAATLRDDLANNCPASVQRPKLFSLGTRDNAVRYKSERENMYSAAKTVSFWAMKQNCTGVVSSSLPNTAKDHIQVDFLSYTGCIQNKELKFYTLVGGTHGNYPAGKTTDYGSASSSDINITGLFWMFAKKYIK